MPRFGKKRNTHYSDDSDDSDDSEDSDDSDNENNRSKNTQYYDKEEFTTTYESTYNSQNIPNTFNIPIIPSGGLEYINCSIWDIEYDIQNLSKIKNNIIIIKKNLSILQLQIKPNQELIDKTLVLIMKTYNII